MLIDRPRATLALIALVILIAACNNGTNTDAAYKSAINDHFKAFPACLWQQPIKFPVQAGASDDAKTQGYDALVQQGLLTRTAAEKKIIIISKQINLYDLSDKGRSTWTPDTSAGVRQFLLRHARRDLDRQLDAGNQRPGREDRQRDVSLQDRQRCGVGQRPRSEDRISQRRHRAELQSLGHGNAHADRRPLGVYEIAAITERPDARGTASPAS